MKTIEEAAEDIRAKRINRSKYDITDAFKDGAEFAQRWIPIEEELPDEHEKVLVKLGTDSIMMGIMDSNNQWGVFWSDGMNGEDADRQITHWRPIELK